MSEAKSTSLPTKEEVLKNEPDLLAGLLEAAKFKDETQKLVQIKRAGKLLFEFHIRPLQESELQDCRKSATKFATNPENRLLKIELDIDYVRLRSYKIYTATVDGDKARIWNNKTLLEKLNVVSGIDAIDEVLMAGEKNAISDLIDEISGYNVSLEDYAKN